MELAHVESDSEHAHGGEHSLLGNDSGETLGNIEVAPMWIWTVRHMRSHPHVTPYFVTDGLNYRIA